MYNSDFFRRRATLSIDMGRLNIEYKPAGEFICEIIEKQCFSIAVAIESVEHEHILIVVNNSYGVSHLVEGALKKHLAYTDVHIKTKNYEGGITGPRFLNEIIFSNGVKVNLLLKNDKYYEEKYKKYVNNDTAVMIIDEWQKECDQDG